MIETEGGFWSFKFQPMSMMDEGPAPARTYRLTRHVNLHFNLRTWKADSLSQPVPKRFEMILRQLSGNFAA